MTNHNFDERCVWTVWIQDTILKITTVFHASLLLLLVIHCLIKILYLLLISRQYTVLLREAYESHNCFNCNRSCTRTQSINSCSLCVTKYFELIAKLAVQGIDITNAHFQYDIINDRLIKFQVIMQNKNK